MAAVVERRLFTREEYHTMRQAGILTQEERVELLEGEVVRKMPCGPSHASVVKRLNKALSTLVGREALVSIRDPLDLDEYSEPEPDVMLLRPRADFYSHAHPSPGDVLLVIEVCDSSLATDRDGKLPLYAQHAIPEVWLVDIEQRQVIVFRNPSGGRFTEERIHRSGDALSIPGLPNQSLALSELAL